MKISTAPISPSRTDLAIRVLHELNFASATERDEGTESHALRLEAIKVLVGALKDTK